VPAGQRLEQHHPDGVHVAANVHVGHRTGRLLRSDVGKSPHDMSGNGLGLERVGVLLGINGLSESKV